MDNEFQFTIGEQYENYEFDVTFIETIIEDNIEYVVYQYKREEKHFLFDIEITEGVFLWFNADILMKAIYVFKGNFLSMFSDYNKGNSYFNSRYVKEYNNTYLEYSKRL